MRKFVLFAVLLAIASPSLAFAGEAQQSNTIRAIKATKMSDAEMERITAGARPVEPGVGLTTATQQGHNTHGGPGFGRGTACLQSNPCGQ